MGFNWIWRGGKPLPACIPVGVLFPWNAEWDHPDTLCRQSRLSLGQHSWCWEHRPHPSPFPAGSSLPSEDPKAQRGLWESGPAESGQRGWSDSIDRNLIPNWLRRRTPARPGFELPGRTNPPVSAGFWEAGSRRPRPKTHCRASWFHMGFSCIPWLPRARSQQEGSEPCGAASDPVSPAEQLLPGTKSTPRPSAPTCRLSRLSSELSGHPGDAGAPRSNSQAIPVEPGTTLTNTGEAAASGLQRAQPGGFIAKVIPKRQGALGS